MEIYTFGKALFNSHYPKINGIQWDYFNGKQWENSPWDSESGERDLARNTQTSSYKV